MSIDECEQWCAQHGLTLEWYDDGPGYPSNPCIEKGRERLVWGSDYEDLDWMVREVIELLDLPED